MTVHFFPVRWMVILTTTCTGEAFTASPRRHYSPHRRQARASRNGPPLSVPSSEFTLRQIRKSFPRLSKSNPAGKGLGGCCVTRQGAQRALRAPHRPPKRVQTCLLLPQLIMVSRFQILSRMKGPRAYLWRCLIRRELMVIISGSIHYFVVVSFGIFPAHFLFSCAHPKAGRNIFFLLFSTFFVDFISFLVMSSENQ